MGKPVFIIAGQSNATNLQSEITAAMQLLLSPDSYTLATVADPGSPLTWGRGDGLLDWATRTELPASLLMAFTNVLDADPSARLGGLVWLQGEADTLDIARATEYASRLASLWDWLRNELSARYGNRDIGLDSFRVVIPRLSDRSAAVEREKWAVVQRQQEIADELIPASVLVNPDSIAMRDGQRDAQMFRDELHFSDLFAPILADALVEALIAPGLTHSLGLREGTYEAGDGADWISPGAGGQVMSGGAGNDTYIVDSTFDIVSENEGDGDDRVVANIDFSLRDHSQAIEGLILTGTSNLDGIGNGIVNLIRGNAGRNSLRGAWGDDTIYGGSGGDHIRGGHGGDVMIGGQGNDQYWFDDVKDRVIEEAGGGHDVILSNIDVVLWMMSQTIEDIVLTGTDDIKGVGNMLANVLLGNSGSNYLGGGGGSDTLIGGGASDTLEGATGDDRLVGGAGSDHFIFCPGSGFDLLCDFTRGDQMRFIGLTGDCIEVRQDGADVLVVYGIGDAIRVHETALQDFDSSSLIFA